MKNEKGKKGPIFFINFFFHVANLNWPQTYLSLTLGSMVLKNNENRKKEVQIGSPFPYYSRLGLRCANLWSVDLA